MSGKKVKALDVKTRKSCKSYGQKDIIRVIRLYQKVYLDRIEDYSRRCIRILGEKKEGLMLEF